MIIQYQNIQDLIKGQNCCIIGCIVSKRIQKNMCFYDVEDSSGKIQIICDDKSLNKLSSYMFYGLVKEKYGTTTNALEIKIDKIKLIGYYANNHLDVLFGENEETKLQYRNIYLKQYGYKNLLYLNNLIKDIQYFFFKRNFIYCETPLLNFANQEGGAKVCNTKIHNQNFSLAQSPQIFKQLLMTSGIRKYFQIAKCIRNEDLRNDRQFEFLQLDVEESFADNENMIKLAIEVIDYIFTLRNQTYTLQYLTYEESIQRYGTDQPFVSDNPQHCIIREDKQDMEYSVIIDSSLINNNEFWKQINHVQYTICSVTKNKLYTNELIDASFILKKMCLMLNPLKNQLCVINKYPTLLNENNQWYNTHHPFTDFELNDNNDITKSTSKGFDIVVNGIEILSGGARIHDKSKQEAILKILNLSLDDFPHMNMFFNQYVPPHAGFGLGLVRLAMALTRENSAREFYPFPVSSSGSYIWNEIKNKQK